LRKTTTFLFEGKTGEKMEAKVHWNGKMSFTGRAETGFDVPMDTYPAFGGENGGFRPMELMALSLAGCTAMDVMSILQKKRQDLTAFEVKVNTDRAEEHPRVFTAAEIEYTISGHGIDETSVLRAIELSATRYCPAQGMLAQIIPIRLAYKIFEDKGNGQAELVASGTWSENKD
jgi:putative redox protein